MSGEQFVERCRSHPALDRVPILVSTAAGAHLDAAAAEVATPFSIEQLLEGIRLCLGADNGEAGEAGAAIC